MNIQEKINYERIAEAIEYLKQNYKQQPTLDEIAEKIHLSPFHFQKLFTEWAGTSPKKFLQYISVEYAKDILRKREATLVDVANEIGFSGTGRLHDLFIQIEGMTPAEYKHGGKNLSIHFNYNSSPFGDILVASTPKGICHLAFYDDEQDAFASLQNHFPNAKFIQRTDSIQKNALSIFSLELSKLPEVKLHLKGSEFQLKVWQALLKIPLGQLSTYGSIAKSIENPNASRAVGTAIGSNPIAFLIPCHRVIQSSGLIGGYMWGNTRKTAIIAWEGAKINP